MCALYTLKTSAKAIQQELKLPILNYWKFVHELTGIEDQKLLEAAEIDLRPQGFLKTSKGPVIFQNSHNQLEIRMMNFSLCPSWSKEFPAKFTTYNARMERPRKDFPDRSEKIFEIPSWKDAFIKGQTCLVPMTSAIESSYFGKSAGKIVGFHRQDKGVFFAAGLYNEWIDRLSGEVHDTFTLITDDPYEFFFEHGHDRSVFIMKPEFYEKWLTGKEMKPQERFDFLRENRINLEWDVTTDREMKEGWEKRAPSAEEVKAIKVWGT